jgi:hypothetical protein
MAVWSKYKIAICSALVLVLLLLSTLALLPREAPPTPNTTPPDTEEGVEVLIEKMTPSPEEEGLTPRAPVIVTDTDYVPPNEVSFEPTPILTGVVIATPIVITEPQPTPTPVPIGAPIPPEKMTCGEYICEDEMSGQTINGVTLYHTWGYYKLEGCPIKEARSGDNFAPIHDFNVGEDGVWLVRYVRTTYEHNGSTILGHLERAFFPHGECPSNEGWERVTDGEEWIRDAGITDKGEVVYYREPVGQADPYVYVRNTSGNRARLFSVKGSAVTLRFVCVDQYCWYFSSSDKAGVFTIEGGVIETFSLRFTATHAMVEKLASEGEYRVESSEVINVKIINDTSVDIRR